MDYRGRMSRLRRRLLDEGFDAVLITNLTNIRYLCGFTGSNGYLLVGQSDAWFFTDGRYSTQSVEEVVAARVAICLSHAEVSKALAVRQEQSKLKRIAFEGAHVSVASAGPGWGLPPGLDKLHSYFEPAELVATSAWVESLRATKEPSEIDLVRTAAEIADAGFTYILERIEVGRTEKELALELEFYMRNNGAEGISFDPIVAAGDRSALPHARPTESRVQKGRYLLLDFGCRYRGYCSDMTRTVVIGPIDDRHREVYEAVLGAQLAGLSAVRAGVTGGAVDKTARDFLAPAGLADAFRHGLGHGVGLEIHEGPTLGKGSEEILQSGNVVTVEPGVYLEGWGGVRVEDLAVVGEQGAEVLSKSSKQLIVL